ncbi:sensor histidine kinase [Endothiovibrio diazotrophicus]
MTNDDPNMEQNGNDGWKAITGTEHTQLGWLFGTILTLMICLPMIATRAVVPYVGLFMAALGIAVAVGQFYIHSIVDRVLFSMRRDFYRGTSVSQLLFGSFILLLSASDILEQNLGYGLQWAAGPFTANLLYYLAYLVGVWSLPAMVLVTVSYLYPLQPKDQQGPMLSLWKFLRFEEYLVRLKAMENPRNLYDDCVWLVRFLLLCAVLFTLGVAYELIVFLLESHRVGMAAVEPDAHIARKTYALFVFAALATFAVCVRLFIERIRRVFREGYGLVGFSFFMSMMALFAFPPFMQLTIAQFAEQKTLLAVGVFTCVVAAILSHFFLLPRLKRSLPLGGNISVLTGGLGRFVPVATEYATIAVSLWIGLALLLFLSSFYYFDRYLPPLFYISFLFYVLGCNYMAAVDLRVASQSATKLRDHAVDDKFLSGVAHEIFNPLVPVQTLVNDATLETILSSSIEGDERLERLRASLLKLLPSARNGLAQAIAYTQEIRNRGTFANVQLERLELAPFVEELIEQYQNHPSVAGGAVKLTTHAVKRPQVLADPKLLKSVLRVLLDNAVESTLPGKENNIAVIVDGRSTRASRPTITIRDEGRGMNGEQLRRFGQPQVSPKPGGTGVGTALAVRFAKEMGGGVKVNSTEGEGSEVQLALRPFGRYERR